MATSSDLSTIVIPLLTQFQQQPVLIAGEIISSEQLAQHHTRSYQLSTPFTLDQLTALPPLGLAILADIIETQSQQQVTEYLATLRNQYAAKILLIVDKTRPSDWQLTDFLALGFRKQADTEHHQLYNYAIESYQFPKDWLNSRYWANPENFDKYRW